MNTQIKSTKLSYRAEIDGLRAIAVISVIFYHAKIVLFGRDWFEGGYVGVDIFFVISGYLITRIILLELYEKESFNFFHFYERRARRILPAFFLVIFCSIPYAWKKFLPSDFVEYSESILSSVFFSSNFFFYFETTAYGADDALLKPFLHTWSLSVEEQFYFFFPVISIFIFKVCKKYFLELLVFLSLVSLQLSEFMGLRDSSLNFYFPFSRFWELGIGSMLAFRDLNYKHSEKSFLVSVFPAFGLYLVVYAILFFDDKTPHPSFYTIVPVLGVCLIIGFSSKEDLVGKILGSKYLIWIGLISYSLYLWHFPVFAFSRNSSENLTNFDKFELIFLTFLLSIISYFFVEKFFRNHYLMPQKLFWSIVFFAFAFIVCFMGYAKYSNGFWQRYEEPQRNIINMFNVPESAALVHPLGYKGRSVHSNKQKVSCRMREPGDACRYGKERIVFLGDSFVGHYERAFIDSLKDFRLGFISFNHDQCPFVSNQVWFGNVANCPYVNEQREKVIESFAEPKIFVISANVDQFKNPKKRKNASQLDGNLSSIDVWNSYFDRVSWLVEKGHKVVLIRSIPNPGLNAKKWLGRNVEYLLKMNFPQIYNKSQPSLIRVLDDSRYVSFNNKNVLVVDPIDTLCDESKDLCIDVKQGYGPLYNNGRHLSYLGAALIADNVREEMTKRDWIE